MQISLQKKVLIKKLSVRQAENLVNLFKKPKKMKFVSKDANLKELENVLISKLGAQSFNKKIKKIILDHISFDYKDLDQLNKLIYIIKANY